MKMTAINRVQGVKVLAGKGKGGKTAFSGDVFDVSTEEAERLKDIGAAEEYKVHDPLGDAEKASGETTETTETTETKKAPAKKAAAKTTGKKAPAKTAEKKAGEENNGGENTNGEEKADDGSDTASDDDLGLND